MLKEQEKKRLEWNGNRKGGNRGREGKINVIMMGTKKEQERKRWEGWESGMMMGRE